VTRRWPWAVLGIDRTSEVAEVRRAYARLLKQTSPEDDPEGFQSLRAAYEAALQQARWVAEEDDEAEDLDGDGDDEAIPTGTAMLDLSRFEGLRLPPTADPAVAPAPIPQVTAPPAAAPVDADRAAAVYALAELDAVLADPAWVATRLGPALEGALRARDALSIDDADHYGRQLAHRLLEADGTEPLLARLREALGWDNEDALGTHDGLRQALAERIEAHVFSRSLEAKGSPFQAGWRTLHREPGASLLLHLAFHPRDERQALELLKRIAAQYPRLLERLPERSRAWWLNRVGKVTLRPYGFVVAIALGLLQAWVMASANDPAPWRAGLGTMALAIGLPAAYVFGIRRLGAWIQDRLGIAAERSRDPVLGGVLAVPLLAGMLPADGMLAVVLGPLCVIASLLGLWWLALTSRPSPQPRSLLEIFAPLIYNLFPYFACAIWWIALTDAPGAYRPTPWMTWVTIFALAAQGAAHGRWLERWHWLPPEVRERTVLALAGAGGLVIALACLRVTDLFAPTAWVALAMLFAVGMRMLVTADAWRERRLFNVVVFVTAPAGWLLGIAARGPTGVPEGLHELIPAFVLPGLASLAFHWREQRLRQ
jgi:hypothetical protein